MKILKTLSKLAKEIPEDFRVQFCLLAANSDLKYDLGKYNPEVIGRPLKEIPSTIIWAYKKHDKDGAYAQLYCVDKRDIPDNCIKRFEAVEKEWLNNVKSNG
jgi:hypothetical protein